MRKIDGRPCRPCCRRRGSVLRRGRPGLSPEEHVLVLTCDGKVIVMRPDLLRPATTKAAADRNKLATCIH